MTKPLERVGVIGLGVLGTQIAMLSAYAGYKVAAYDTRPNAFDEMYQKLREDLKAKTDAPLIPWDDWERCRQGVSIRGTLEETLEDVDLVVEAVKEDVELKREIFRQMGEVAPPKTIFATNSSSLPISKMEASSGRPERCLNIHFYQPLQGMNMADVMGGTRTLPEVLEKAADWVRSLGLVPLRVNKEVLGFCFNGVWRAIKKQSLYLWANGFVDFRDIDRAWRIFTGMKMGPFGIMDAVGLDTVYDIEMVYFEESKDERDKPPEALVEKVRKGELGVKTGKGFYTYPNPEFLHPDFLNPRK